MYVLKKINSELSLSHRIAINQNLTLTDDCFQKTRFWISFILKCIRKHSNMTSAFEVGRQFKLHLILLNRLVQHIKHLIRSGRLKIPPKHLTSYLNAPLERTFFFPFFLPFVFLKYQSGMASKIFQNINCQNYDQIQY